MTIAIVGADINLSNNLGMALKEYGEVVIFATIEELIEEIKKGLCPEVIFWKKEFSLPAPPPPNEGIPWGFIWELVWIRRRNPKVKIVLMSVYNYTSGGVIADALVAFFLGIPFGDVQLSNLLTKLFPTTATAAKAAR